LPLEGAWPDASAAKAMTNPKIEHPKQETPLLGDIRIFLEG
jgi:hypothetical protein